MKRKKLYSPLSVLLIITVLFSAVFLPGCRSSGMGNGAGASAVPQNPDVYVPAAPSETHSTVPTTLPSESTTAATKPVVEYITPSEYPQISTHGYNLQTPVLPIPTEDAPEEEWLAFFYGLLLPIDSWYNKGVCCFYEKPEEMDLLVLFIDGITAIPESSELTDEEVAFLEEDAKNFHGKDYLDFFHPDDFSRMPAEEVESVLQIYFATSLEECGKVNPITIRYWEKTNCYYMGFSGRTYAHIEGIVGYQVLENGDYAVRYMSDMVAYPYGQGEVILHRNGDYFQIVANRIVE